MGSLLAAARPGRAGLLRRRHPDRRGVRAPRGELVDCPRRLLDGDPAIAGRRCAPDGRTGGRRHRRRARWPARGGVPAAGAARLDGQCRGRGFPAAGWQPSDEGPALDVDAAHACCCCATSASTRRGRARRAVALVRRTAAGSTTTSPSSTARSSRASTAGPSRSAPTSARTSSASSRDCSATSSTTAAGTARPSTARCARRSTRRSACSRGCSRTSGDRRLAEPSAARRRGEEYLLERQLFRRRPPARSSTRRACSSRSRPAGTTTCCARSTTSAPPATRRTSGWPRRSSWSGRSGSPTARGCSRTPIRAVPLRARGRRRTAQPLEHPAGAAGSRAAVIRA